MPNTSDRPLTPGTSQLGWPRVNPYNTGSINAGAGEAILGGSIQGKVVSVTDAGDAITDIGIDRLEGVPTDETVSISCDGHVTSCIFPSDHEEPEMTFLAIHGSSGFLELVLVGESASAFLGIRPGSEVTIKW